MPNAGFIRLIGTLSFGVLCVCVPACSKERTIDPQRPQAFAESNFPKLFLRKMPIHSGTEFEVFEEEAAVRVSNGFDAVVLTSEMIETSRRMNSDGAPAGDIQINSVPMSLADAVSTAEKLCAVVGISPAKLRKWHDQKEYEQVFGTTFSDAIRGADGILQTVEIKISFDEQKPWRILYHVDFPITLPK